MAGGEPAAVLLQGLFGPVRQLYKRFAQFSAFQNPQQYRQLARKPYAYLVVCAENLADVLSERLNMRVEAHEGFSAVAEGAYLAALVTELDEALELEGLAREFVRRVQDLRKQADLNVDDAISVEFTATERLARAVEAHREYIMTETVARSLHESKDPEKIAGSTYNFDDEELALSVSSDGV